MDDDREAANKEKGKSSLFFSTIFSTGSTKYFQLGFK